MTAAHFLLDAVPDGDRIALGGDEGRHAARVRRLAVGEVLTVGDGRGTVADCVVAAVRPDGLDLTVTSRRLVPAPELRIVVVQALAKGERAELAVELMTELGVDEIVPWAAARSVVQWRDSRGEKALGRWRGTAREAVKQSRRAWAPVITAPATTTEVAARLRAATGFALHEAAATPLASAAVPARGEAVLVVGPEGGLTDDELVRFAGAGATAVRLGEPVLRTSTAGAAALAVLSVRSGRWS